MTTEEREELLLAAKAAGLTVMPGLHPTKLFLDNGNEWNPRTSDGDQCRLARNCKLVIDYERGSVWLPGRDQFSSPDQQFTPGNNEEEAKAIVAAAAELGARIH